MAPYRWTRQQKFKHGVWACAFAAIIFVGTYTGAQLKTDNEKKEVSFSFPELLFPSGVHCSITAIILKHHH